MISFETKSGSVYQVDAKTKRIRKLKGGTGTKRIAEDWRVYEDLDIIPTEGLRIFWGSGRDEVSEELGTPEDVTPMRMTVTSPLVRWFESNEDGEVTA